MTVTPGGTIVDGDEITLTGIGFPPGELAATAQCRSEVIGEEDLDLCDLGNFNFGTVAANGTITLRLTIHRFIQVDGQAVDCAVPGTCLTGISSGSLANPSAITAVELDIDDTVANDAPLEVDVSLSRWSSRSADLAVSCSRPATLHLRGLLVQKRQFGIAAVRGHRQVECDVASTTRIVMKPDPEYQRFGDIQPYERLLVGPAQLNI